MDRRTVAAYDDSDEERFDAYEGADVHRLHELLLRRTEAGQRVLDIGCGTGRDLAFLSEHGRLVTGVDASATMLDAARERHPELRDHVARKCLPFDDKDDLFGQSFDCILCQAVLMHIPDGELFTVAFQLKSLLRPDGTLIISTSTGRPGLEDDRDGKERLFRERDPTEIQLLFERLGFSLVERRDPSDGLGRDIQWHTLVLELRDGRDARPLDTVERILNRDAKVATYKLALFRALAELASADDPSARWLSDGTVQIPTRILAEKWLEYYWPIVASPKRIPQTTSKAIAFRKPLDELIREFAGLGNLPSFLSHLHNDTLPQPTRKLHRACMSKLMGTIWNQPVKYAGGGAAFSIFDYDRKTKSVVVPGPLWRELALAGPWIRDAAILRWAELTEQIAKSKGSDITCADVLQCLLTRPDGDRRVQDARSVYAALPAEICVWTEQSLSRGFEVDHVIPFSLWHNNELWNLLPAHPRANARKSDQLPSATALVTSKARIIHYWTTLRDSEYQRRFDVEGARFCGLEPKPFGRNWEAPLFTALTRGIEVTASQRGVPRWKPSQTRRTSTRTKPKPTSTVAATPRQDCTPLPFFPDLAIACGYFREGQSLYEPTTVWVPDPGQRLDPARHVVVQVSGDSMDGGNTPIRDGDHLLLEKLSPQRAGSLTAERALAVEYREPSGDTAYALKQIRKDPDGSYILHSWHPDHLDIPVDPNTMFPWARFDRMVQPDWAPSGT